MFRSARSCFTTRAVAVGAAVTLLAGCAPGHRDRPDHPDHPDHPAHPDRPAAAGKPGATATADALDVQHYGLDLDYAVTTRRLTGTATIDLVARRDLSRVVLNLRGPQTLSVRVDGHEAGFRQGGGKLVITPAVPLTAGVSAVAEIRYRGTMGTPKDANGTPYGWIATPDGAQVLSEPDGAPTWFPAHDVLTDKATYDFRVTVPRGRTAVANGVPAGHHDHGGRTTWTWRARDPMLSYLATVGIGDYDLTRSTGPQGIPIIDAVDRHLTATAAEDTRAALAEQQAVLRFLIGRWGPYPFSAAGAIVDDDRLGYALETQTRPVYATDVDDTTIVHELAHQWFGDSVNIGSWRDIWLNEGFAVYSEWLWEDQAYGEKYGATLDASAADVLALPAGDPIWKVTLADPTRAQLFDRAVYDRGALVLYELRKTIGDQDFWRLARTWAGQRTQTGVSTADFEELAGRISGQDLTGFFRTWLHSAGKPSI
ncbi:M1 family metallopeptidase [Kineosporia sp. J2-2]|uniref:Aminopeptidase N n=1 Tax=Kineosporia corallincola TaxID=2835133 RepID=A0ABS5TKC9_9ACTN|nr:M1 family metallopeptidase [Kineosporia corallincola]MBT0771558.1 M1 family metallopeptidase [Kineosporia corallincola]